MKPRERVVVVSFSTARNLRDDGWWVTVLGGNGPTGEGGAYGYREFGPYPDEDTAVEATGGLLRQLVDGEDAGDRA